MAPPQLVSLILVKGRTIDDFDRVLESFPATKVGDTWEAASWSEAELALTGDVKVACEVRGWLSVFDAEARLPYERSSCFSLAAKFETTVFALLSDEQRDFHYFSYHSEERSRTMLCIGGAAQEETGLALFQETGLGMCASGRAGVLDLLRRIAFDFDCLRDASRYMLKRVYQVTVDPVDAGVEG